MVQALYVIGIAGPSGCGKSSLAGAVAKAMPPPHPPVLSADSFYRDLSHLPVPDRDHVNFDHPQAIEVSRLLQVVDQLRHGGIASIPHYDFRTHTRLASTSTMETRRFLVIEGLHLLFWPELRQCLDNSFYLDLDTDVCLHRRLQRDVVERGRRRDDVIHQFETSVLPMQEQFVRPSRQYAGQILDATEPLDHLVRKVLKALPQEFQKT